VILRSNASVNFTGSAACVASRKAVAAEKRMA
jgi:hypothetical protein